MNASLCLSILACLGACTAPKSDSSPAGRPGAETPAQRSIAPAVGPESPPGPFQDLNLNGIDDAVDIATGTSLDEDGNGLPDDGEAMWPASAGRRE
ncbi:MAG: hypothetical protein AAFU73_03935 [Planctomycetota bacterium]